MAKPGSKKNQPQDESFHDSEGCEEREQICYLSPHHKLCQSGTDCPTSDEGEEAGGSQGSTTTET